MVDRNQPETARQHEEPFAFQFSIFVANRLGQLSDIFDVFSEEELSVVGLSVVDSTDWAVVRLVFSDANKAREMLRNHGFPFTETPILLVELPTQDALGDMTNRLLQAEIGIHFCYPLMIQREVSPILAVHLEDPVMAKQLLTKHGFTLVGEEDLADPT